MNDKDFECDHLPGIAYAVARPFQLVVEQFDGCDVPEGLLERLKGIRDECLKVVLDADPRLAEFIRERQ